jgi:hypothetical protein
MTSRTPLTACLSCGSTDLASCAEANLELWIEDTNMRAYNPRGTFYLCRACGKTELFVENVDELARVLTEQRARQEEAARRKQAWDARIAAIPEKPRRRWLSR